MAVAGAALATSAARGSEILTSTLHEKLKHKGFAPRHVMEVGVYLPHTSQAREYAEAGVRCTLVEPNPAAVDAITRYFGRMSNVSLHPVAVYDEPGTLELVRRGASTYAASIGQSPAVVNDLYRAGEGDRFQVPAVRIDQIDDGSVDLLCVDIEGGEWFVLKHLRSRPAVIAVETHGGLYRNPHLKDIERWMRTNGYDLWYKDKSDSTYVRRDAVPLTVGDTLGLLAAEVRLGFTRLRKTLKRRFRLKGETGR